MGKETKTDDTPADPFEGFQTEVYSDGVAAEPPKADDKADDKPAPKGEQKASAQSVPHIDDEDDDPLSAFTDQDEEDDDAALHTDDQGSGDELDGAGHDDDSAADDDDEDGDGEADENDDQSESDDDAPPRNKVPLKKRLSQLTAARRRAERENAELKARIAALEKGEAPAKGEVSAQDDKSGNRDSGDDKKAAPELRDADGNVLEKPDPAKYTYGEVDSDYINDVVNYNVEARLAKDRAANEQRQAQAAEQTKAQELRQRWDAIEDQGAEKYDDFEDVVLKPAVKGEFPLTREMAEEIGSSDAAVDIVYHLARNPKEAVKVAGLEGKDLARYIGRLEAAIQTRDKQRDKGERRMSQANPPPRRQARGAGGKFVSKAASPDFAAFEAQAMAEASKDRKR